MYSTQRNPHLWSKISDWMSDRQAQRSWRTASRPLSLLRDPLVMPHRWVVFGGQGGWRITSGTKQYSRAPNLERFDNLDFWDLEMQEMQQIRSRFEFRIFCCFILKIYLGTLSPPGMFEDDFPNFLFGAWRVIFWGCTNLSAQIKTPASSMCEIWSFNQCVGKNWGHIDPDCQ